jgi:hypothetical protein
MSKPPRHEVDLHVRDSREVAQALARYAEREFQGNVSQAMRNVFRIGLRELGLFPAPQPETPTPQP